MWLKSILDVINKQAKWTLLSNCHNQNSSNEQEKSSKLGGPGLAVSSVELLVEEDTPQSRNEESTSAERIANGISKSASSGGIAEVTNSKEKSRPDS